MKKIVGAFAKTKKNRDKFYCICSDVTLELPTEFSEENISNSGTYKSFHFDESCLTEGDHDSCENFIQENTKQKIKYSKRKSLPHCVSSTSQALSEDNSLLLGKAYENSERKKKSDSPHLKFKKLNQLKISENLADVKHKEKNCIESQLYQNEGKKSKNSVYIINISNGKNFHIGSQATVNVGDPVEENFKSLQGEKIYCLVELEKLMDSEESVTENIIQLIALNFEKKWKNFGRALEFNEDILDEIEVRYENKILKIYDIFQRYIELFPNTSLGFIVSILKDNYQLKVIQKLFQNKCWT